MTHAQNGHYVLLVDASKVFQQIFTTSLADCGLTVVLAQSGQQALELLGKHPFAMICSAMYLEDMEGIDLCRRIRAHHAYAHKAFILFTAEYIPLIQQKLLPAGVTDIFHKSEVQELVNFIRRYPFDVAVCQGRVLYIEDSASQRILVSRIFRGHGLQVDEYSNAEEALEAFAQHNYDLVVTDVVLEGRMSGLVLANRIRRLSGEQGDVPILAITAFDDDSRRIELFHMGVSDYVIKPVLEMELMARVRNLLVQRKLLNQLREQRAKADQANIAKNAFLSAMSHELRTPLNAVLGFSQLLESDQQHPLPVDQLDSVTEIRRAGEHLLEFVNDVLDLSKIEAGKMSVQCIAMPLQPLLDSCLDMVAAVAESGEIHLHCEKVAAELAILADPLRLKQALLNLLSNAIKYNRRGGSVTVEVTPAGDTHWQIGVQDTGHGIPAEQHSLIFQPFSRLQVHASIEGTGIGLVVTKNLVELMNGSLNFTSEPGKGSRFTVRLPAATTA